MNVQKYENQRKTEIFTQHKIFTKYQFSFLVIIKKNKILFTVLTFEIFTK